MLLPSLMKPNKVSKLILRSFSTVPKQKETILVNGTVYPTDDYTNITPKIQSYMNRNLHLTESNPLCFVRQRIINYFYSAYKNTRGNPIFSVYDNFNPIVSTKENFDDLLIAEDHISRSKKDCYYVNRKTMLRAHMTAHQSELLKSGLDNFLMIGDVYRRDEIDSTHFPVFHQVDAVSSLTRDQLFPSQPDLKLFEPTYKIGSPTLPPKDCETLESAKQECHTLEATKVMEHKLKQALLGMVKALFGEKIQYRWVDAYFPFTHPSWELEIYYNDKWLEVLGCGIVRNEILLNAGPTNKIAYAFGLGLERLAMAMYEIPDIRLFWSTDPGFVNQFKGKNINSSIKYKAISSFPPCTNDLSFWLPENMTKEDFSDNDFYDMVRDIGGDVVEQVHVKDKFTHPKTKRHSICYRIVYRHMEKTLSNAEANQIHKAIEETAKSSFGVTIR